jgi:CRISPR-associated protein Csx17
LGFDRGISEFRRIGFYKGRVGGDNYFTAIDRGSIKPSRNQTVDLLKSCHEWIDHFRRAATKDGAPALASRALRVLEDSIIDLCISHTPDRLLAVFIALGQCQAAAARSLKWATHKDSFKPLQGLRKEWLKHGWHRPEFRLAASLASINGKFGKERLTLRCHLEQVDCFKKDKDNLAYRWADNPTNNVQWSAAPLPEVLNDILARRLILNEDTEKRWEVHAELADIKAFIEGETDDALLSDLLWSMSLINWSEKGGLPLHQPERVVPPTLYALLKLCFPPVQKELPAPILPVPTVPAIHRHAANGNGTEAAALALRRLRASGYRPLIRQLPTQGSHASRTAAALLFPISNHTLEDNYKQTTRPEKEPETAAA